MDRLINQKVVSSPIRWAGSKKKLLNEMLYTFDTSKSIYIEPFLGSGVVLINVLNNKMFDKYYVNDVNNNLILFYKKLRDNPKEIIEKINTLCREYNECISSEAKCEYYYSKRKSFNQKKIKDLTRASVFWFLMTAGYNGVYRINAKGQFNVPCGKRERIVCDKEKMKTISELIQRVEFYCMDYMGFFELMQKKEDFNDIFMYCDPPYIPETAASKIHVLYTQQMFSHEKFSAHIEQMDKKKLSMMVSMAETKEALQIYDTGRLQKYDICDIVRRVNPQKKIVSKEIAFFNYIIN